MKNKGQQQHTLAVKNGSLMNPEGQTINGLIDLIKLKSQPKIVYYFDFLVCIDQSGNPFIFYHDKNRYINIPTISPAQMISYIDNKGGQLAIALQNKSIQIVSCQNGRNLKTLKGHEHHILSLHTNHTQNLLLSVSQDQCILHSLDSFDKVHSLFSKGSIFVGASFLPSSTELATVMADRSLSIWNLSSFEIISRIQLPEQFNIKFCQMVPSIDGQRLIINCHSNKIYILDNNNNLITQDVNQGYGNGVLLVKPIKKQQVLMLTKNFMIIQIDSSGNLIKCIEILQGKTPTHFDVYQNKIAIILNTGEIALYDLNKLAKQNQNLNSTIGVNVSTMIKENYADTLNFNNTTTNIDIKKVGNNTNTMQGSFSQSVVSKKNSKSNSMSQPINSHTLGKIYKNSEDPLKELLNYQRLQQFLTQYHVFPDDKRSLIWRSLLNLPMNQEAYNNLINQGIHPAYQKLADQYPLQSESLFSRLQRTLSCLAYYCPLFAEIDYLPQLVFPFVKLFKRGEELLIFEATLSLLIQHCQRFFENFPNAPVSLLQFHDQVFNQVDPQLYQHMKQYLGYSPIKYAWPSIRQLYTNLMNKNQWIQLIDHLILYNDLPQMIVLFMVEYFSYFKNTIMRMNDQDQLDLFFARSNTVEIDRLIESTINLSKSLDMDQYQINLQFLLPLQKDQYQLFSIYPKGSVQYQARVREQLQEDEQRLIQKQQQISRLQQMAQQMEQLDQLFQEKQLLTMQAEKDRQEMFDYQVEMRAQKQFQQDQQVRQQRIKQLENLEKNMNQAVQKQLDLQQQEQEYLNKQFRKTQLADNFRIVSLQEEEALQNLEYQIFSKFQQQMEQRAKQENQRKIQSQLEFRQKEKELLDQIKQEQWKMDSQQQQIKVEQLKQLRMQQLQELENEAQIEEVEYHERIHQFQQDLKMIQLEREKKLRDQMFSEQISKEEQQLRDKKQVEDKKRQSSVQRRQQFEQEMERLAKQHQEKLRMQEQQLMEQYKKSQSFSNQQYQPNYYQNSNYQNNFEQSSGDIREPMTSQKLSSALYDFQSSQKQQQFSPSMLVEDEREKINQLRNQLRDEMQNIREREHDEHLQSMLREREQEIFKRTQQIRDQINQEVENKNNSTYNTGQFQKQQQYYSPGSSSQFSLYKPQQEVDIEPRDLSESQLTYSSGFTSPGQRY
ncbi:unnamed protein product [Paramecium octaurelia]|uniref:Rab-GAP TBC domain-containing protein n=1 Tax=Paramecium octaurelia TaxID=43137 RepID=A0A8S1SSY9_PAROT|nr:unnamed protein product [Paramecium octaurelia]